MKRWWSLTLGALFFATGLSAQAVHADDEAVRYAITITNVTRGQVITPPVVISHNQGFKLFTVGAPAIPELAALAEDGPTAPLLSLLPSVPTVLDFTAATAPVLPGASVTLEVRTSGLFRSITAVGMLATTNDAFFAVQGVTAPKNGNATIEAEAYDAGSERNSESCAFIPGPPCGSAGVRDTAGAEGYVHIHAGIHGIGDLVPATHDWRNPVAEIMIRRIP
ncbi:MAG: spondin domain-containing protein [Nitrospirota bacterium]